MKRRSAVLHPVAVAVVAVLACSACTSGRKSTAPKTNANLPLSSTTTLAVTYNRTCEKAAQSQTAMDLCAGSELKDLKEQLAMALSKERLVVDANLVDAAEGTFQRYRLTECSAVASRYKGGTIYPLIETNCEVGLTIQRIQQVRLDAIPAP